MPYHLPRRDDSPADVPVGAGRCPPRRPPRRRRAARRAVVSGSQAGMVDEDPAVGAEPQEEQPEADQPGEPPRPVVQPGVGFQPSGGAGALLADQPHRVGGAERGGVVIRGHANYFKTQSPADGRRVRHRTAAAHPDAAAALRADRHGGSAAGWQGGGPTGVAAALRAGHCAVAGRRADRHGGPRPARRRMPGWAGHRRRRSGAGDAGRGQTAGGRPAGRAAARCAAPTAGTPPGSAPRTAGAGRAARRPRSSAGSTTMTWSYSRPLASVAGTTVTRAAAVDVVGGRGRRCPAAASAARSRSTAASAAITADRALVLERRAHLGHRRRRQVGHRHDVERAVAAQRHRRRYVDAERRQQPVGQRDHHRGHPEADGQRHHRPRPACPGGRGTSRQSRGRPRRGALGQVAEQGDRAVLAAPGDRPALHRGQVLRLVDDHVAEAGRPFDQPGRLVDQHRVGGRPPGRLRRSGAASPSAAAPAPRR